MIRLKVACASLALLAVTGAAYAQSDTTAKDNMAPSNSMSTNSMSSSDSMHMSKAQMASMNKCKAMTHDAMMKSSKCVAMMKAHPDMMKGAPMTSDGMSH